MLPFEITEIVDREFETPRFKSGCSEIYLANARAFIVSKLANKLADSRRKQGMFDALEREGDWDEDTDLSLGASGKGPPNLQMLSLTSTAFFSGRKGGC